PAFTQWSYGTPGVYRNTPPGNVVCWTTCGHPGSIVMGADPDPFIRQQILRDASGFFGGGGREALSALAGSAAALTDSLKDIFLMKAIWRDEVIAESDRTLEVGGYRYFPRESVRME